MRGDEEGTPCPERPKSRSHKGTARDGVDAGGGFVKKYDLGRVNDGASEGEPLLPSAGELAGAALEIVLDAGEGRDLLHALFCLLAVDAIDTGVEGKVLLDGQVFVEAELLRHSRRGI